MTNRYLRNIDPLVAFIEYVKDTKPFHTKILEVLEEYLHNDAVNITVDDKHFFGDPNCKIFPPNDQGARIDNNGNEIINDSCKWKGIEIFQPGYEPDVNCLIGYSSKPFGSPGYIPIVSPNQSLSFPEYPAIDTENNVIYVPGDYTSYIKQGDKILITIRMEDFCNIHKVTYHFNIPDEPSVPDPDPDPDPDPEFYDLILIKDIFENVDSQTNFNLSFTCPDENLAVYVNGVKLTDIDFTQTSTTTFSINTEILSPGDAIEARTWSTTSSYIIKRRREIFTDASSNYTTTFTCKVGNMNVYLNGTKLIDGDNYNQLSENEFTLSKGINVENNDIIEAEAWVTESDIVSIHRKNSTYTGVKGETDFNLTHFETIKGNLDVFNNGTKLIESNDYSQSTKNTFTLNNDVDSSGDILSAETIIFQLDTQSSTLSNLQSNIQRTARSERPGINTNYPVNWNDNYFIINGNQTDFFLEGLVFFGDGIAYRKKFTTITASYNSDYDQTAVLVYPLISDKDKLNIRYIGLILTDVTRNEYYTVKDATHLGGSVPSWPDTDRPETFVFGDDPHTKVTLEEQIPSPPEVTNPSCQGIVAFIKSESFIVENALGYSDYLRYYDFEGSPVEVQGVEQTPNEGYFCAKVTKATKSLVDEDSNHIPGTGLFEISGLLDSSNIFVGSIVTVKNSANNVGTYQITALEYFEDTVKTLINVEEAVASNYDHYGEDCGTMSCYLNSSQCQDVAYFKIPANVLIVDGDRTDIFVQGKRFQIDNGSLAGEYTTHSSRFINGKTHIRTTSTLLNENKGFDIAEVIEYSGNLYGFVVYGDVTGRFEEGSTFNIIDSESNDGSYTVESPGSFILNYGSYDPPLPTRTEIPIHSDAEITGVRLGRVIPFKPGEINQKIFGFSEYEEWCSNVSHTVAKVKFDEKMEIIGAMLPLHDDIIGYNFENTNLLGYEMSSSTIFMDANDDGDGPGIPGVNDDALVCRCDTEPDHADGEGNGSYFWFDQPNAQLKRSINDEWAVIPSNTIWWVRTETYTLDDNTTQTFYHEKYYKKIYLDTARQYLETPWIMDSPESEPHGLDIIQPAKGNLKLLNTYSFTPRLEEAPALEGYMIIQDTYELASLTGGANVYIGPDMDSGSPAIPDRGLVRVLVNNVPAFYRFVDVEEINDNFLVSIKIITPRLNREDNVVVEVYERIEEVVDEKIHYNAHVNSFDMTHNTFYHQTVGVYRDSNPLASPERAHGAYVVGGGNFLKRFVNETQFVTHTIKERRPEVKIQRAKLLPIVAVHRAKKEFLLDGDYTWFFSSGRICKLLLYRSEHIEFLIDRSFYVAGQTFVEIVPPEDDRPDDYETSILFDEYVTAVEIDHITDTITIPCDRTGGVGIGDELEITNSTAGNDGFYTITRATYDFAFDQTDIEVSEDIIASETGTGRIYLTPPVEKYAIGVAYEPTPQEIKMDDYQTTTDSIFTDATYLIPTAPVNPSVVNVGIDYFYRGPIRVETDYNGPKDNRVENWEGVQIKAEENKFIVSHTGYKNYDTVTEPPAQTIGDDNPDTEKLGLVHQIKTGNLFKLRFSAGFYGCEDLYKSNDGYYAVKSSTWDDTNSETHIDVVTEYDDLPPYGTFIIEATEGVVNGIGGRLKFRGNLVSTIDSLTINKLYVRANSDLISPNPKDNFVTIINHWYDATTRQTVVDVEETILDGYSGTASLVDYTFSPGIFFDSNRLLVTSRVRLRKNMVAAVNQTVFPCVYTVDETSVYFNGMLLNRDVDYTADNGTTIEFLKNVNAGDIISVFTFVESRESRSCINRGDWIGIMDQTEFPFTYTPGNIDVYLNGVLLNSNDYVASNGSEIVLVEPSYDDDAITAISYEEVSNDIITKYNVSSWVGGGPTTFPVTYTPGSVLVYVNGAMLHSTDFDDSSGTEIILTQGINPGETTTVIYFDIAEIADFSDEPELWNNGTLVWKGLSLEDNFASDDKIAKTTIGETISFEWDGRRISSETEIVSIDPNRNIIMLKPNSNIDSIQRGDFITVSGTINNNNTFMVEEAAVKNGIPFIKVMETLAYGTVDVILKASGTKVKVIGHLRNKIKAGGEVIINGVKNTAKGVSYNKPNSYITFEEEIPEKNIQQIWFKERKGKVVAK